ncbi:MAG: serine/threonine protein kinase, partial [Deltaproteobacteria bacterium]|nr:serine/threonine protein kinase [Deltaproteobacteria bacterium]
MVQTRRYRILGTLGRGGFGTVYRADLLGESGFTRQVALKVLNPDMENVENVAGRLRDEARLLGLLRHRAIVDVAGLVRLDNRWTVVMEYVEGADLSKIPEPVPQGPALEILGEVAGALHVAYAQPGPSGEPLRLLHRDIKPQNILVTANGEVKVLDFGVARANFAGREAQTRAMLFGSVGYMAPERYDRKEGPAADVFAMGIVLYEILSGHAFGRASAREDKFDERKQEALAELRASGRVLDEVTEFVSEMMAYEAGDRPTAREVETRCRDLRLEARGEWLRDWAEHAIPPLVLTQDQLEAHDFSSDILTESQYGTGDLDGGWPDRPDDAAPGWRSASPPTYDDPGGTFAGPKPTGKSLPTYPPEEDDEDESAATPPPPPKAPPLSPATLRQVGVSKA